MANTTPKRIVVRRTTGKTQPKKMSEVIASKEAVTPSSVITTNGVEVPPPKPIITGRTARPKPVTDRAAKLNDLVAYTAGPTSPKNYTGKQHMAPGSARFTLELDEGTMEWLYLLVKARLRDSMHSSYDLILPEAHDLYLRLIKECFEAWCRVHGKPKPNRPHKALQVGGKRVTVKRTTSAKPVRKIVVRKSTSTTKD